MRRMKKGKIRVLEIKILTEKYCGKNTEDN
jgi:hypothetical protein